MRRRRRPWRPRRRLPPTDAPPPPAAAHGGDVRVAPRDPRGLGQRHRLGRRRAGSGRRRALVEAHRRRDAPSRARARQGCHPARTRPSCRTCWWFRSARRSASGTKTPSSTTSSRSRSRTSSTPASTSRAARTPRRFDIRASCRPCATSTRRCWASSTSSTRPYYAQADGAGAFTIKGVPPGDYELFVWHEAASKTVAAACDRRRRWPARRRGDDRRRQARARSSSPTNPASPANPIWATEPFRPGRLSLTNRHTGSSACTPKSSAADHHPVPRPQPAIPSPFTGPNRG